MALVEPTLRSAAGLLQQLVAGDGSLGDAPLLDDSSSSTGGGVPGNCTIPANTSSTTNPSDHVRFPMHPGLASHTVADGRRFIHSVMVSVVTARCRCTLLCRSG